MLDWNGVEGREVVLELLSYSPVAPFEGNFRTFSEVRDMLIL